MNRLFLFLFLFSWVLVNCSGTASAPFNNSAFNVSGTKYLYVASGNCYGGGVVTSSGPANTVAKFNLTTGAFEQLVIDYNSIAPADSPVSISDFDSENLLVLVENTGGRRVDLVKKDGSGSSTYLVNATAFTSVMKSLVLLSDYSLLISRSSSIEKFSSAKARLLLGVTPFVNAPAGACATSTTLISSIAVHSSGKIVYTHAAASPNNKIGVISSTGYAGAADCNSGTAGPTTTSLPTSAIFHPNGKLLVAYGSTTGAGNSIYSYDFSGTNGGVFNPVAVFSDSGTVVNGPSSLAVDPVSTDVFVANVTAGFNTIERFQFANNVLTRAASRPFIAYGAYTRCISAMKVMN